MLAKQESTRKADRLGRMKQQKLADTTQKLVQRASRGDREALAQLCESIARSVLFRVIRLLPGHPDTEDVAQEVLIRVCKNIHTLREPQAFGGWLNSILINTTRQHLKSTSKHTNNVLYFEDGINDIEDESASVLPEGYSLQEEEYETVVSIVDTLPARQREAVMLHYFEGLGVSETADVMSISQPSASQYLKLARNKIKEELVQRSKEPEQGRLRALAAMPIGLLLAQSFEHEALLFGAQNTSYASSLPFQEMAREAVEVQAGLSTHALAGIVASVSLVSVAAGVVVFGILPGNAASDTTPEQAVTADVERRVVFRGGDATHAHLNPAQAELVMVGDTNSYTVVDWEIAGSQGADVLYSGSGSLVEEPFSRLPDGEYTISFTVVDEAGRYFLPYSNFQILREVAR